MWFHRKIEWMIVIILFEFCRQDLLAGTLHFSTLSYDPTIPHTHVVVVRRNSKVLRRLRLWWIQLLFYWHSIWRRWLLPMFLDFKWGIIIRYVIRIQTLQKLAFESGGNLLYRFSFKGKFTLLKFARALESLKVRTLCNFEKKA